ncbi:hypothetical protein I3842_09G084800 [Carya illinoinensis]|uniref:Uncharacterized protein n=1 Tax=Carya illinoinensis TaxID=32201 RepID=A0A922E1Y0_CARIL|nr:hypothetical protein I3842_09G084800 [Carya illinoinensis]
MQDFVDQPHGGYGYCSSTRGVNFVDNVIYLVHDLHPIPIL